MDKVMTQVDLPTKHVMGSTPKTVNAIASKRTRSYEDDVEESLMKKFGFC